MTRHVASTFFALALGGLVAGGGWAAAQQASEDRDQNQATARDTERDAENQNQENQNQENAQEEQQQAERQRQQREQREREQREREQRERQQREQQERQQREQQERQQREQQERQQRERLQDEQSRDQRSQQDQRFQDQRSQDQRFQDQRFQDQRFQDQRSQQDQRFQDQRFQDQRFQDQRFQDRDPRDRQAFDDRRGSRQPQAEEQGAWLGVYLADAPQQNGVLVRSIYPTGPAARAGFRSGDVIVAIDGQRVSEPAQAIQIIDRMQPRSQAEIVVLRNNQQVTLTSTLGDRQTFMTQQRGEFFQQGQRGGEEDDYASVPPHLMELEHHRRMAEQHQRIEEMIERLHQEVRQLREELRGGARR